MNKPATPETTARSARLELHLPTETKRMIERASAICGMTLTEFVLTHAAIHAETVVARTERARERLAEQRKFCEVAQAL